MPDNNIIKEKSSLTLEAMLEIEDKYFIPNFSGLTKEIKTVFKTGNNSRLIDYNGHEMIDFLEMTSTVGHLNPVVKKSIEEQLNELWNVYVFSTPIRAQVCQELARLCPPGIDTFSFYSSGTETIEAILRAVNYYAHPRKKQLAGYIQGYHGKTMGSRMIANWIFGRNVSPAHLASLRLEYPVCYRCRLNEKYPACQLKCVEKVEEQLEQNKRIAAFIFEPIVATGGIYIPPREYWPKIEKLIKERNILFIADEISTGGWRTGKFLAIEHWSVQPDIIAFSKGIGNGFPTMVMAGKKEIFSTRGLADTGGASSTFSANPLGLAAIRGTLQAVQEGHIEENVAKNEKIMRNALSDFYHQFKIIGDYRGLGMFWGIELVKNRETKQPAEEEAVRIFHACFKRGIKIGYKQNILYLAPPLSIEEEELNQGLKILEECLSQYNNQI